MKYADRLTFDPEQVKQTGRKTNLRILVSLLFVALSTSVGAQTLELIYSFTNSFSAPRNPTGGGLLCGPDGNFYGTTEYGGEGGFGTVFKLTPAGALTTLATFGPSTGGVPLGGVTFGPDGNLYGTTSFPKSTIFKVSTNGGLLEQFILTNGGGHAGVTFGPDGTIYGTTISGGANSNGTVYRLDTNGLFTTLYSFDATINFTNVSGSTPYGGLTWGPDGNLYGTTFEGGPYQDGTVFRITTNGEFSALSNFTYTNGQNPQATMIVGPGGAMYGTTLNGGDGVVFRLTTNGVLTVLTSFNEFDGASPEAGVIFGPDGNLYGTTSTGGTGYFGTVFRLTTNGSLTTLANFNNTNGSYPETSLTFGLDGQLYGTTWSGDQSGTNAEGEVFRLDVGLARTNALPNIAVSSNGAVVLELPVATGSTSRLWSATNLLQPSDQWSVLATNFVAFPLFRFVDTNAGASSERFYRTTTP
jgi:uncharacterized repeat protein (TIGR03803 family)